MRPAVVELMRQGVVLAAKRPSQFEQLQRHLPQVRHYLATLWLEVVLDESAGIALLQQQLSSEAKESHPELIPPRPLTLYDTLLLLVLRRHFQQRETAGEEQITIDIEQIESQLLPFLPLTNSARQDRRKLSGALERLRERKIIQPLRSESGRYEITAVIRYVVGAEFLQQLLLEYEQLLPASSAPPSRL